MTMPPCNQLADPVDPCPAPGLPCLASLDKDLTILAAGAGFLQLFGGTAATVCGRHLYNLFHPTAQPPLERAFDRLSADGQRFTQRVIGLSEDRLPFVACVTGMIMYGSQDSSAYVIAVSPTAEPPDDGQAPPVRRTPAVTLLAPVDARILEGIARGASNVRLSAQLYLSRQGVEYRIGRLLRQLKATNRAALVARAQYIGMFIAGSWPPRVLPRFVAAPDADGAVTTAETGPRIPASRTACTRSACPNCGLGAAGPGPQESWRA